MMFMTHSLTCCAVSAQHHQTPKNTLRLTVMLANTLTVVLEPGVRVSGTLQGDKCPYSHDTKLEPCKQLVLRGECRFGPACHFSHGPLPEDAVMPLQEWFREQDLLKEVRCGAQAQKPNLPPEVKTDPQAEPDHIAEKDAMMDDCDDDCQGNADKAQLMSDAYPASSSQEPDQSSALHAGSVAAGGYRSWQDGWQKLYADRLKLRNQIPAAPPDPATFAPLTGPYKSWNDGWKSLFAKNAPTAS